MTFVQFAGGFATLAERKTYLQQHAELLTEDAVEVANTLIRGWREKGFDKSRLVPLRLFRTLLKRAIEAGVELAFTEAEPSREVTTAVAALLRADAGDDLLAILSANRRWLTSPQALGAFNFLRAQYEDDPDKLRSIEACWDSVGMFRDDAEPDAHRSRNSGNSRT